MLQISAAKEIRGSIEAPPNSDLFFLSMALALASGCRTTVSPVVRTPRTDAWTGAFGEHAEITFDKQDCLIVPRSGRAFPALRLDYGDIPFRDFVVFLLLGRLESLVVAGLPPKRLERWSATAGRLGCELKAGQPDGAFELSIDKKDHFRLPDLCIGPDDIHPYIGLAMGLRKSVSCTVDQALSSPLRNCLPVFGYECVVKALRTTSDDPLERRFRFLQTGKKSEGPLLFSVLIDFSGDPAPEARVTLPGDDVFASLMLAAKCLVHKGSLVVENVCLEGWSSQLLQSLRAMGCNIAVQQTRECSFGAVGNAVVQKFSPSGRKFECTPFWQYSSQLPAMTVSAAFAQGQSIFRGIEDLRLDEPDGVGLMDGCLAALGARYGEMPDGLVVEGARQYDGFDLREELPAPLAGAFAVAGLKCRGKTTIADLDLLRRWPDFEKLLSSVCELKE